MRQVSNGRGDAVQSLHLSPFTNLARRSLPAVALAAFIASLAGSAVAEVAPPLDYETLRKTSKLYETVRKTAGDLITLQVRIVRRSDQSDEKKLTELLARNKLTSKDFCDDQSKSLYVSTTLSGVWVGKAKNANPYESLSKYCLTGPADNKIWSFVVSNTVARDYTRVDSSSGNMLQHRNFVLMGLSSRPDADHGVGRLNRYPDLALAVSETMSKTSEDLEPLSYSKQFLILPSGASFKRLSTSDAYASAIDIGGLALLAKTIKIPLATEPELTPLIFIQGRVVPLSLSVQELPRGEGDAYSPFRLEVRAKQGAKPIVIQVKGDRERTINDVDLPFMQGLVSLYETFRPFLGQ